MLNSDFESFNKYISFCEPNITSKLTRFQIFIQGVPTLTSNVDSLSTQSHHHQLPQHNFDDHFDFEFASAASKDTNTTTTSTPTVPSAFALGEAFGNLSVTSNGMSNKGVSFDEAFGISSKLDTAVASELLIWPC
jgi:hypothetical protein